METSAKQLLGLINDLLDLSRIETQKIALDEMDFSLRELINEVTSISAVQAVKKGVELINEYACGDFRVTGDPLRLKQVLTNVLGNAVKFTEKGQVRIRTRCEDRPPENAAISIDIIDTGIGIPKDKLDMIFNEFYQGDTSITRKYGGTGLGLSITKTLLDLMGGQITVASAPNQGSRFTITLTLPLSRAGSGKSAASSGSAQKKSRAGAHILLVEDNEANTLVATSILENLGYSCLTAASGKQAIDLLVTNDVDLILMDIQMPEMDGFATTRFIRERERLYNKDRLPIIGVTAHTLVGDRDKCIEAGMDDYLSKPFRIEELETILDKHLKAWNQA
jgi:CheY-like chemotaxis protein